jgi:hypothetical protein
MTRLSQILVKAHCSPPAHVAALTPDEILDQSSTIHWELRTLSEVPDLRIDYAAEDEALKGPPG